MGALKMFARVTGLPLLALVSACGGGGGGGLAGTPPPPAASYTKIVDMTGDRTFQTGGIQYNAGGGFSNASTQAFGSGVTVAYTAASDSYRLTAPDGSTVTFAPSDAQAPPAGTTSQVWVKTSGTLREQLYLTVPTISGVPLSYTLLGSWGHIDNGVSTFRLAVGGAQTLASDMPKTGTATYSTATSGSAFTSGVTGSLVLAGNSTATFSANFGTGAISTSLTLAGTPSIGGGSTVTSLGTFNGTGTIASNGPGFTGTLSGTGATGIFSGAFFGPKALEMGYDWALSGANISAVGSTTGVKN